MKAGIIVGIWGVVCLNIGRFWGLWEGRRKGRQEMANEVNALARREERAKQAVSKGSKR